MTKRTINKREEDEYTYHVESAADGTEYKVGCDCDGHQQDVDWIQCTNVDCDVWHCQQSVADEYNLIAAELKILNEHENLFKCRAHEPEEIDLKKCITEFVESNGEAIVSHYNLRKRSKPSAEFTDDCLEELEFLFNDEETVPEEKESRLIFDDEECNQNDFEIPVVVNKKKSPPKKKRTSVAKKKKGAGNYRKRKATGKGRGRGRGKAKQADDITVAQQINRSMNYILSYLMIYRNLLFDILVHNLMQSKWI